MNVLDPCCGSRMMWFDKADQRTLFGDCRKETHILPDRQYQRHLEIKPDVKLDFTKLPFDNNTFKLVVFDPPHLVHAGAKSWLAKKYGTLGDDWKVDIRDGFRECMRVLKPYGVLIFKWNEEQVKFAVVKRLFPCQPLFGQRRGKTFWVVFMKDVGLNNDTDS